MARHRRDIKARTRGPGNDNPRHRRDVRPDSVPATWDYVTLYVVPNPTNNNNADNNAGADTEPERAG